jgi:hypothetical protein
MLKKWWEIIVRKWNLLRKEWVTRRFSRNPKSAMEALRDELLRSSKGADIEYLLLAAMVADELLCKGVVTLDALGVTRGQFDAILGAVQNRVLLDMSNNAVLKERAIRLREFFQNKSYRGFNLRTFHEDLDLIADGVYRDAFDLDAGWAARRMWEACCLIHYCGLAPKSLGFQPWKLLQILDRTEEDVRSALTSGEISKEAIGLSDENLDTLFGPFREWLKGQAASAVDWQKPTR